MKGKAGSNKSTQAEKDLKDERGTPVWFYRALDDHFSFDLDVCASDLNHKHKFYYTKADNALEQNWEEMNFMNPPYSDMMPWIEKAYQETLRGCCTVALLKSDHSTKAFRRLAEVADIWLIAPRLAYEGAKASADFQSLIAVFSPDPVLKIRLIRVDKHDTSWAKRILLNLP